jgi:hypothetical protein
MDVPSQAELDQMIRETLRFLDRHQTEQPAEVAEYAAELRRRLESRDYEGLGFTPQMLDRLRNGTLFPAD